jgi:cation diffusion facilitator CzcD-associated flavoprotein CzcO
MCTNLSRFTCSFSDLPWRTSTLPCRLFPKSYEVQQYLQEYASLSKDIFRFNTKVACVEHKSRQNQSLWKLSLLPDGGEETSEDFDFVIVASGFFARPWLPQSLLPFSSYYPKVAMQPPRVLHSAEYAFDRILSLFPCANTAHVDHSPRKRKIVVVGGSLSAVEVISDLCINNNSIRSEAPSAERNPGQTTRPVDMSNLWEIVHVVPRPFWVLPRFLPHLKRTPGDTSSSSTSPPKFLPLDLLLYDVSKLRKPPPATHILLRQKQNDFISPTRTSVLFWGTHHMLKLIFLLT